jgi:hypothetical protein
MPPQTSKKSEQKAKEKIIEDKTFGLKNKNKSSKVQKYVQQVAQQVKTGGNPKAKKEEEARELARKQKKEEEAKKAEEALLFKPVIAPQKVPFGTDPKSVLCQHFKVGLCNKGDKCKFSHDLNIGKKSAKVDVYTDMRDGETPAADDTMDKWDQSKLESVINKKHHSQASKGPVTTTDIICKYFLDAIENSKYGWFWECPNGSDSCKYRHALPPGYVLKPKKNANDEDGEDAENAITLEEFLESERHKIAGVLTPVTEETFKRWKDDRKRKEAEEARQKEAEIRAGRVTASGKELFALNPELFQQDDEEAMEEEYLTERQQDQTIEQGETDGLDAINQDLFLDEDMAALEVEDD